MRGSGRSKMAAGASSSRRTRTHASLHACVEQTFSQELQDNQVAVLVNDEAGEFVCLAETQAASIVGRVEHGFAARDGRAQTRCEQLRATPRDRALRARPTATRFAMPGYKAQCQERSRVGRRQAEQFLPAGKSDGDYVRCVDPEMAAAQTVGGAAADDGADRPGGRRRARWARARGEDSRRAGSRGTLPGNAAAEPPCAATCADVFARRLRGCADVSGL